MSSHDFLSPDLKSSNVFLNNFINLISHIKGIILCNLSSSIFSQYISFSEFTHGNDLPQVLTSSSLLWCMDTKIKFLPLVDF